MPGFYLLCGDLWARLSTAYNRSTTTLLYNLAAKPLRWLILSMLPVLGLQGHMHQANFSQP